MAKVTEEWNKQKHGSAAMRGRQMSIRNGHIPSPILEGYGQMWCEGFPKKIEKKISQRKMDEIANEFSRLMR